MTCAHIKVQPVEEPEAEVSPADVPAAQDTPAEDEQKDAA